jgi:type III secretion protein J
MKTMRTLFLSLILPVLLAALAACTAELQHDLTETDANALLVLLEARGIAADKARDPHSDGWMVVVPDADRAAAWRAMKEAGLPRRAAQGFDGLYPSGGLIPAPDEARVRLQAATAGELERSLQSLEGVLDARVHLVLPEVGRPGLGKGTAQTARASVLLRVRGSNAGLSERAAALVSGAVQGMASQSVTVIVDRAAPDEVHTPELASLGPFRVAPASIGPLRGLLGGLLIAVLGLGGLAIALIIRIRRLRLDAQRDP